jgi:hypothetical protein
MSLIICSSSQEEYTRTAGQQGDNNAEAARVMKSMNGLASPATFTNFMRSPILLEPDSEVAVQSVRIQRDPVYTVSDSTVAYKYIGPEVSLPTVSESIRDTVWAPSPVRLKEGNYTPSGFREKCEDALSEVKLPGQTWEITPNACATTQSASLSQGGHFIAVQESSAVGGGADWINASNCSETLVDADWGDYIDRTIYTFDKTHSIPKSDKYTIGTANTGKDLITRNVASSAQSFDHQSIAILKRPIINSSGNMKFKINSLPNGGHFAIGLTRATSSGPFNGSGLSSDFNLAQMGLCPESMATDGKNGIDGWEYIEGYNDPANASGFLGPVRSSGNNVFFDYVCELNSTDLRVYQYVKDTTEERGIMKEVMYWDQATTNDLTDRIQNASFGTTAQAANTGYGYIEWILKGDQLSLIMYSDDAIGLPGTVLVDPVQNASKVHTFVPIGSTKSALYPKIQLSDEDSGFEVHNCVTTDPGATGADEWKYPASGPAGVVAGSDYWSCNFWAKQPRFQGTDEEWIYNGPPVMPGVNGLSNWNFVMDTREVYNYIAMTTANSASFTTFIGNKNASYGFAGANVLIMSDQDVNRNSSRYLTEYQNIQPPNLAPALGFGGVIGMLTPSVALTINPAVYARTAWRSRVEPDLLVSSAFVKLRNGPQTSYNAGLGSISKILYHVPRFTNDGRQYGDLFFECGEKTYVAMRNTDRAVLNSLDIDIVDRNDRIVKDLTGSTIVVLHIRKRR